MPSKAQFIEVMAKHLPPSASNLNLLDIGGIAGDTLYERRPDLKIEIASLSTNHWIYADNSFDSVVAYDILLKPDLLHAVLNVMRAGGRFIVVNPVASVEERWVKILEDTGFIRILVEPALYGEGVLIRGEKAHNTTDTLERIESVATSDADLLNLDNYKGRFVHLLIVQRPNKPVWKMQVDEKIEWQAVAIEKNNDLNLLAFSSLPKAVSFMQSAVMAGFIRDVNKIGKFSKETAKNWTLVTLLNPTLASVSYYTVRLFSINPNTAETSDE